MEHRAFTLIELLVVVTIIAVLAAILFPVFSRAKDQAKKATCVSNLHQNGLAVVMYLADYDARYPQTRQASANPAVDDASGAIDEPVYGSVFDRLGPYDAGSEARLDACPVDPDPVGVACMALDPDAPDVTSYLANAYFVFGLSESAVSSPASTIYFAERRSGEGAGAAPYCDNIYHPWFNASNPVAPEDEMDPLNGAVATTRHREMANYGFVDGHVKTLPWAATYAPPAINLHKLVQD